MSKVFLKANELHLVNGGYLSNKDGDAPVYNEAFVNAQQHAEYIVTFARMAKGKNFKEVKADSLTDLKQEVADFLNKDKKITFVEKPKMIERKTTDALAKEALAFIDFQKDSSIADKINDFMQQFKILQEFEEHGLFFEENIVKLNKIYTVADVLAAVKETIDLI